jgi:hypothetical protein
MRHRQVQDDVHPSPFEKVGDAPGAGHAVLRGLLPRPLLVEVRAGDHLEVLRGAAVLQINVADLAAPDYADLHRRVFAHDNVLLL